MMFDCFVNRLKSIAHRIEHPKPMHSANGSWSLSVGSAWTIFHSRGAASSGRLSGVCHLLQPSAASSRTQPAYPCSAACGEPHLASPWSSRALYFDPAWLTP